MKNIKYLIYVLLISALSLGWSWSPINPPSGGGSGTGDFTGPSASADAEVVIFNSTTGKIGKRSYLKFAGPTSTLRTWTGPDADATLVYNHIASVLLGTASTATGSAVFYNVGNANTFTIQPGTTGANISWTLPIAVPGGNNYLLNASTAGVLGYTDPATFYTIPSLVGKANYALMVNPGATAIDLYAVPAWPLGWTNIALVGATGAPAHKATPIGADFMYLGDSASSNAHSYATLTELSAQITAAKATILATARAINGVNFDGSAPITIPSKPIVGTIADGVNDGGTYKVYPSTDGTATGTKVTHFNVTAAAHDITIEIPVGSWTDGENIVIRVKGTGARALTFITSAGGFRAGDTNPGALPITTVTTKTVYMGFKYNSADSYFDYVGNAANF